MVRISGLTGERERGALPTCKVALLRACRETRREGELAGLGARFHIRVNLGPLA